MAHKVLRWRYTNPEVMEKPFPMVWQYIDVWMYLELLAQSVAIEAIYNWD